MGAPCDESKANVLITTKLFKMHKNKEKKIIRLHMAYTCNCNLMCKTNQIFDQSFIKDAKNLQRWIVDKWDQFITQCGEKNVLLVCF